MGLSTGLHRGPNRRPTGASLIDRRALIAGGASLAGVALAGAGPARARDLARPTRELMVPVEGGRVYVRVDGDLAGARAPIIMAHGGPGGTHASFLEALALAGERAVILYDQLDSGRSDHPNNPANWRVSRFVDELEAIRAALGVARWHMLGASWGGTIALEYGARRPAGAIFERDRSAPACAEHVPASDTQRGADRLQLIYEARDAPVGRVVGVIGAAGIELVVEDHRPLASERERFEEARVRSPGAAMGHDDRRARAGEVAIDADIDAPALDRDHQLARRPREISRPRGAGTGQRDARQAGTASDQRAAVDQ